MSGNLAQDIFSWLNALHDVVHLRSPEGLLVYCNQRATTLFGWKSPTTPISIGDESLVGPGLKIARKTGFWSGDLIRKDTHGNDVLMESRWTALDASEGFDGGFFVIELDVSERRQSDANLIRAQRMESISSLAGGVAHDINNVLGPILMGAEMIKRRVDDPWIKKKLESIESSARRGAEIVKQVLDFSRGAQGEKIVVQIRHTLNDVVDFAKHTFSKSIIIEGDFPLDLTPIFGDAAQIRQCVLNIMVNARDVMPEGGTLSLSAANQTLTVTEALAISPHGTEGSFVRIDIRDTGSGIADNVVDRIFEPFFTTKTRGQGTGLGLSTALSIVQGHGGFLAVSGQTGAGATFSIYLPVALRESESTADSGLSSGPANIGGRTILVVDDEPIMLEMNVDMLESFNYKTLSAENGQIGLDRFLADPAAIDLIVTDINMPVMDGTTMILEIRKVRPDLPIIAVSGLSEQQHLSEGVGLDGIQIVSKPYSTDQLLEAVFEKLGGRSTRNTPSGTSGDESGTDTLSDNAFDKLMDGDDW